MNLKSTLSERGQAQGPTQWRVLLAGNVQNGQICGDREYSGGCQGPGGQGEWGVTDPWVRFPLEW